MRKARAVLECFWTAHGYFTGTITAVGVQAKLKGHEAERTADELWGRLETLTRERGESIEELADNVSELCDSLSYPNLRMRYQLFRRRLRNKRYLAVLASSLVCDIPEAVVGLLFKDMTTLSKKRTSFRWTRNH
ncbi:hypothetical protein PHMEG_00040196 [Phytophthora megakarya]|uniref:Uncharacterized protein n=1 Tax=Phytophthora megakarya TaxID=4795 RepID=A0A225UE54_9STRA|nr:hypothetical protein PHMEG_00040196 [Phytophthora megakarya]